MRECGSGRADRPVEMISNFIGGRHLPIVRVLMNASLWPSMSWCYLDQNALRTALRNLLSLSDSQSLSEVFKFNPISSVLKDSSLSCGAFCGAGEKMFSSFENSISFKPSLFCEHGQGFPEMRLDSCQSVILSVGWLLLLPSPSLHVLTLGVRACLLRQWIRRDN